MRENDATSDLRVGQSPYLTRAGAERLAARICHKLYDVATTVARDGDSRDCDWVVVCKISAVAQADSDAGQS